MQFSSLRSPQLTLFQSLFATSLLLIFTTAVALGATEYPELPGFHQVDALLYRGGQPREGGIRRLAELGVNTIVNLRGADARTRADESEARTLGLNYFNIPLPVWGRPDDARVRRVMQIIEDQESGIVFVHCKDGVDRTGVIVALHRITQQGWSSDVAGAEARRYGMRRYQYWMHDYINDYHSGRQRAPVEGDAQWANDGHDDIEDRIGVGVRVGERAAFRLKKRAVRLARRVPGVVNEFLGKVF